MEGFLEGQTKKEAVRDHTELRSFCSFLNLTPGPVLLLVLQRVPKKLTQGHSALPPSDAGLPGPCFLNLSCSPVTFTPATSSAGTERGMRQTENQPTVTRWFQGVQGAGNCADDSPTEQLPQPPPTSTGQNLRMPTFYSTMQIFKMMPSPMTSGTSRGGAGHTICKEGCAVPTPALQGLL
ncbi:hypothetical protein CB1_000854002 [Camelus ferus]|nr:hypothetical protein CB1_000854002 [Camelus ferus]